MANSPEIRRILFIGAPPAKVWKALTEPRLTRDYYFGMKLRTRLRKGGAFCYESAGAGGFREVIRGRIVGFKPERRLQVSFSFNHLQEPASKVIFNLRPFGKATEMTLLHTGFGRSPATFTLASDGWDWILSGLKTRVETGKPLRA